MHIHGFRTAAIALASTALNWECTACGDALEWVSADHLVKFERGEMQHLAPLNWSHRSAYQMSASELWDAERGVVRGASNNSGVLPFDSLHQLAVFEIQFQVEQDISLLPVGTSKVQEEVSDLDRALEKLGTEQGRPVPGFLAMNELAANYALEFARWEEALNLWEPPHGIVAVTYDCMGNFMGRG